MKVYHILMLVTLLLTSCSREHEYDEHDAISFFFDEIKCPHTNKNIETYKVCATSYSINSDIKIDMVADKNDIIFFENKWEEPLIKKFMLLAYCESIPNSLGLDRDALLGNTVGLFQLVVRDKFKNPNSNLVRNTLEKINLRFIAESDDYTYIVIKDAIGSTSRMSCHYSRKLNYKN